MTWARKRQLITIAIVVGFFVIIGFFVWFFLLRAAPSCIDNKQNGDEEGIDCGGSCSYMCTNALANPVPIVKFARVVSPLPGRADVIAYIDNPNKEAAVLAVPYTLEVYDTNNILASRREGVFALPAGVTTPLFIPNAVVGREALSRAFLTIDPSRVHWTAQMPLPRQTVLENVELQTGEEPRITAVVRNTSVEPVAKTPFVATLFDDQGNALAASATLIENIPPKGSVPVVFTWSTPFTSEVARIEILPVLAPLLP